MNRQIQTACLVMLLLHLTAILPSNQAIQPVKDSGPVVRTRAGPVRGRRAQDGSYSMFLGVPYATVDPTNPFGAAIPHFFEGVLEAFDDSARCPQVEEFNNTITGTLDCLHLNIYVPDSACPDKPVAVMVNIFGGNFDFGFAGRYLYGPRFLVRHDVIFVTFNYRLGPYGFMCLDTPEVPGNRGLKDQVLALRWIKQNIHSFGGDESRITLLGNSAGGISVDLHAHFLKERLYDRIILQSGVSIISGIFLKSDPNIPLKIAMELNHTTNDINDALTFLTGVNPHELIAATNKSGVTLGPCVENKFDNADTYITEHPINVIRLNNVKNVDVLIGVTNDEKYASCTKRNKELCESLDFVSFSLNNTFEFRDDNLFTEIKDIVKHFYYGDDSKQSIRLRMDGYSDFFITHPTLRTVQKYLDSGVGNMYLYMFSYAGERNFAKDIMNMSFAEGGATHADELGYIFDVSYMKNRTHADDMLIVDRMTELWTKFAKYGNPTPWPTTLIPLRWPGVARGKMPYMEIDTDMKVVSRPRHQRMAFLDLLYKAIGQYQRLYVAGRTYI